VSQSRDNNRDQDAPQQKRGRRRSIVSMSPSCSEAEPKQEWHSLRKHSHEALAFTGRASLPVSFNNRVMLIEDSGCWCLMRWRWCLAALEVQ
jgi:hypothetical protein